MFGVSSDEYLNYALLNKAEWIKKGNDIVDKFHQQAIKKYSSSKSIKTGNVSGDEDNGERNEDGNDPIPPPKKSHFGQACL